MRNLMITALMVLLTSCTTYTVKKEATDGSSTTVKVRSTRDLEQPEVDYIRKGTDAEFHFSAASANNSTEMFDSMMGMMMNMMKMTMGVTADPARDDK